MASVVQHTKRKKNKKRKGTVQALLPPQPPQPPQSVVSVETKFDPSVLKLLQLTGVRWETVPHREDRHRLCSGSDARLYELDDTPHLILKRIEPQCSVLSSKTGHFPPRECYFIEKEQDMWDVLEENEETLDTVNLSQIVVTPDAVYSDNAMNELLVNSVLQHLITSQVTPHVLVVNSLYYNPTDGASMCMERYDWDLDEFASRYSTWWNLERMAAIIFQAMHALYVLQSTVQLKHHDLHDQNIAISRITETTTFRGQPLWGVPSFLYTVDGVEYRVPNVGYLVKITDMGFASATVGGRRLQRIDLDYFNDKPSSYGYWNADFENNKGYDLQVLVTRYMTPTFHKLCKKNRDMKHFMEVLYFSSLGQHGKMSEKQRPLVVNNEPVSAIIHKVFGTGGASKKTSSGVNFLSACHTNDSSNSSSSGSTTTSNANAAADFTTPNLAEVHATFQQFFQL